MFCWKKLNLQDCSSSQQHAMVDTNSWFFRPMLESTPANEHLVTGLGSHLGERCQA